MQTGTLQGEMEKKEPSFSGSFRRITYLRTSSSFDKLKSFLIFEARFGPRRRGTVVSVNPGISPSPKKKSSNPLYGRYKTIIWI